jgi:threonine aldolase
MRFLAAPWVGMLENGAWLKRAEHANACARYMADQIADIAGARMLAYPEANAVFVQAPDEVFEAMHRLGWKFYTFIGGAARFMCSWDTERSRIDELCRDLRVCAAKDSLLVK